MKMLLRILLIVVIVLLVPAVLILINRIKAAKLDKIYPMLGAQHPGGRLELVELKLKGKTLEYLRENVTRDRSEEMRKAFPGLEPANYWPKDGGYVSYDRVKKLFRIATSEYVATPEGAMDEIKHVNFFDEHGYAQGYLSQRFNIDTPWRKNDVLLPDHVPNFPRWHDPSSTLQVKHFGIGALETAWLNPFRGMGSPTGVQPAPAWSGMGYFELHVAGEIIRFRSPVTKYGLLFLDRDDLSTDLSYCRFPGQDNTSSLPGFLVFDPRHDQGKVLILKFKE